MPAKCGQNGQVDPQLATALREVDLTELGRRIRGSRVGKGLTQGQLAESVASIGYISRIEAGQRRPDGRLLEKIAERLDTSVEHLVLGVTRDELAEAQLQLDYAEIALASGDVDAARELVTRLLARLGDSPSDMRRRAAIVQAAVNEASGELDAAILVLEDLVAAEPADLLWLRSVISLSRCYRESADLARAIECGETAQARLAELGLDSTAEAIQVAVTVAAAHYEQGNVGHAVRICQRAVTKAEALDSPMARAAAYWNASLMESDRGSVEAALSLASKALSTLEAADDNRNLARLRTMLGVLMLRQDPPAVAEARSALDLAGRELEWSSASAIDRARNEVALARVALFEGDYDETVERVRRALAGVGDEAPMLAADATALLGQVALATGDADSAASHFQDAVLALSAVGADRKAAQLWFDLGALLESIGADEQARDAYKRAAASTGLTAERASARSLL